METIRTAPVRLAVAFAFLACAHAAHALDVSNRFRSPRNPERRVRATTELIVLHTTEAPARSSLNKLSDRGEAHYCVTESGGIYRIVDRDREAFHAGRSMWRGREDVDKFSVGIECVGYHNKPMPSVQLAAIRALVHALQAMYRLSDDKVVAHSHVAYGTPNRWQKRRHRGRKRCGMLFAMASVRRTLGLSARPACDVDVRAGRLAIGDDYLNSVLYGHVDTMVGRTAPASSPSIFSGLGRWFGAGTRQDAAKAGSAGKATAARPARKNQTAIRATAPPRSHTSVSAKPTAKRTLGATKAKGGASVRPTLPSAPPNSVAQLKARGYVQLGTVSKKVTASRLAGAKWNAADTFYVIRGRVTPGNRLNAAHIEQGMTVWRRR